MRHHYYSERRRESWRAAVVAALEAHRALALSDKLRWEKLALCALGRWVRWVELEDKDTLGMRQT